MPNLPLLTPLTLVSALAVGLVLALLGNLKLQFARHSNLSEAQFRRLLTLVNASLIPLLLVAGLLVDLWGVRPALLVGSILLSLAFLALSSRLGYHGTLAATLTGALGGSALAIATYVLMPAALLGKDQVAASFQLGMVFVPLGAVVLLPLFDLLQSFLGFRRCMALLALVLLVPAFLAALPPREAFPASHEDRPLAVLFQDQRIWVAGLVFCCYAPLEALISVWTTGHLEHPSLAARQTRWLACFWLAMLSSRLLLAFVQHIDLGDVFNRHFLVILALFAAVLLGNLAGTTRREAALPWLIALGLCLGPIYPLLVGMVFQLPGGEAAPGTALALVHAIGSLASLLMTLVVSSVLHARTIATSLRLPLVTAMALTTVALLFVLMAGWSQQ